jgi:hypothetical protein
MAVSYRFISIAIALMLVSYVSVRMLSVGQLMPSAKIPSFHRVGSSDDPRQNQAIDSDSDEVRDSLRRDVLTTAEDLRQSPCNDYMRDRYIAAATKYARAWLSIAPCFPRCGGNRTEEDQLNRAARAFKTPFDDRVTEAMAAAHKTDTIREGDFTPDVVLWVAMRSRDIAMNPAADPAARKGVRESRAPLTCRPDPK